MTALGTIIGRGVLASRPSAGIAGQLYYGTDTLRWYRDNGSSWDDASGNPMTTSGDIVYGGASGLPTRLAKGTDGQILTLASGVPSWASGAGARVYNSGNVSLSSGTETTITYDSERYDTDAFHSTSSNTSRLTVPTGLGGKYHIGAGVSITTSSGTPTYIRILLNGTTVIAVAHVTESASFEAATIACDYALAQGDYVEFQVYVQNGSKNAIAAANYSPEFWLHKIN